MVKGEMNLGRDFCIGPLQNCEEKRMVVHMDLEYAAALAENKVKLKDENKKRERTDELLSKMRRKRIEKKAANAESEGEGEDAPEREAEEDAEQATKEFIAAEDAKKKEAAKAKGKAEGQKKIAQARKLSKRKKSVVRSRSRSSSPVVPPLRNRRRSRSRGPSVRRDSSSDSPLAHRTPAPGTSANTQLSHFQSEQLAQRSQNSRVETKKMLTKEKGGSAYVQQATEYPDDEEAIAEALKQSSRYGQGPSGLSSRGVSPGRSQSVVRREEVVTPSEEGDRELTVDDEIINQDDKIIQPPPCGSSDKKCKECDKEFPTRYKSGTSCPHCGYWLHQTCINGFIKDKPNQCTSERGTGTRKYKIIVA